MMMIRRISSCILCAFTHIFVVIESVENIVRQATKQINDKP